MTVDLEALKALQQEDEARRALQALEVSAKMRADFITVLTALGTWQGMKKHPIFIWVSLLAMFILVATTGSVGFFFLFLLAAVCGAAKLALRYFV